MKNYIHEIRNCKERIITRKSYDVLMIGGGMSGLCAAIASARQGARMAIVQDRNVFGGNASSEAKMHISGAPCHWGKKDTAETGALMESQPENKYLSDSYNYSIWDGVLWSAAMNRESLDVYMNTTMDMVDFDGFCIHCAQCYQVATENRYEFGVKVSVDATGDGTLGYFAGAGYKIGREVAAEYGEQDVPEQADGETMGNTTYFVAEDMEYPVKFVKPGWVYTSMEEDSVYRYHGDIVAYHSANDAVVLEPGEDYRDHEDELVEKYDVKSGYRWIELGGDWDDTIEQSEDIRYEFYRTAYGVWDHIKNGEDHGAEDYKLTWVGNLGGMRKSRRLTGDYVLMEQDTLSNRVFEDAMAYGGWPMDEYVTAGLRARGQIPSRACSFKGLYPTPYGCFCSRTMENLMMTGRNIPASKSAIGSTRMTGTCVVGSETVGVVTAGAALNGLTLSEYGRFHRKELQQKLLKNGLYAPGCRSEDEDGKARLAKLSAISQQSGYEVENLISGVTRREGDQSNLWMSKGIREGGEAVVLELKEPSSTSQVRLVFDPDLSGERCISVSRAFMEKKPRGVAKTLVKGYRVGALFGGKTVACRGARGNHQRLNAVEFDEVVMVDAVRTTSWGTNGCENVQMYEVRTY